MLWRKQHQARALKRLLKIFEVLRINMFRSVTLRMSTYWDALGWSD